MRSSVSKIVLVLCLTFVVGTARADERSELLDRQATTLYQQVFSPFCPGRSLNDCPSSKAAELKNEMRSELEAGKAPEVILNEVIQKFGEEYRAVPRFAGVGMFVWLAPIGFVVVGLMIAVGLSIRRKKSASTEPARGTPVLSPEEERRIQEELSRLE